MNAKLQRAKYAALLVLGGAIGASFALEAARMLQIRVAEDALLRYAQGILGIEEKSGEEFRAASRQFSGDNLGFCSDDEIGAMRRFVYNATFVKDVGRVKNGYIYCTSSNGKLETPLPMPAPTYSFSTLDGGQRIDVTPNTKLLLAPDSRGVVLVSGGVSIVLNPAFYDHFDHPPMRATWLLHDREHGMVDYAFGHPEPLTGPEVLAERLVERDGIIYQPLCSRKYQVCVVAAESRRDMLSRQQGYYIRFAVTSSVFSAVGALFGISIASTILLLYHRQRSFAQRLRRAVRRREITCVYQPIVDLESGEIKAAETLARWTNDSGEEVPPDVFIAVAEARGFLGEITLLVMDRMFADLAPLLTNKAFHATINISASDLRDPRFFAHLDRCLQRNAVAPTTVGFEITEHSTALQEEAIAAIARLRAAGHSVYLDDFGTGYSSLAYLQDLHANAIKIDRAFTQTVGTEAVTASVVPQILEMASKLGLNVIIEGIETAEQAAYFRAACKGGLGQGWLFGRPVPAHEFIAIFKARGSAGNPASVADPAPPA